ncbi:MAG: hypothetical protein IPO80_04630 [Propionibacteriaceae bacterium]|nr:hypothetical protein [Propionibacteriaceae bacterium]
MFVVRDSRARAQQEIEGLVGPYDDRALVMQTEAATLLKTRSPRARYGRTGKGGLRHIDLEELCSTLCSADDLFEAFRLEGAL